MKPPALRRRNPRTRRDPVQVERLESRRLLAVTAQQYGQIPLSFEANQGQTDSQVEYLTRGAARRCSSPRRPRR